MEAYTMKAKLGEGSFGTVWKAVKDGQPYAIKVIEGINPFKKDEVEAEIEIMKKLSHPHLVKIYQSHYDEANETFYIVMDLCEFGDFLVYTKSKDKIFSNDEILGLFKQMVDAFITMNGKGIIHRDLKPENILISKGGVLKVADFGCARILQSQQVSKIMAHSIDKGTPCFASPQLLQSQPYSAKCDVWSVGCILYLMAYKKLPFYDKKVTAIIKMIREMTEDKEIELPLTEVVSDEVKYAIKRCLTFKDIERSSWREFSLCRIFSSKLNSIKQYVEYWKSVSNIANWISKVFWKERKKYTITENKDEIFIYFIIKFQLSILKLCERIMNKDTTFRYLFNEQAFYKQDVDPTYIENFKTNYLDQTEEYFNLIQKVIKSPTVLQTINAKKTTCFLPFADLQNSIKAAYKILVEIMPQLKSGDEKVIAIMSQWMNFERYFDVENQPYLEKLILLKIDNVKECVESEALKALSGKYA